MYYITQEAPVVQTLEIALRDWAKGLRTVRCQVIMLVGCYVIIMVWSHLVVRLRT
jgi:hypothetical protein